MTSGNAWLDQARWLVAGLGQSLAAASAAPTAGSTAASTTAPGEDATEDAAPHAGDCRWCPLCQAVAVLRGERPELTAALADALGAAAAALRTLGEPPGTSAGSAGDEPAEEDDAGTAAGSVVQRIEIA